MTPDDTWREACKLIGVWKAGQRCPNDGCFHTQFRRVREQSIYFVDHDIPPPPVGDPAAAVKMLPYFARKANHSEWVKFHDDLLDDKPAADLLAAAIVALKENQK
jgi:hypothetical protein